MGQFANVVAKFANTTEQRMDATVRGAALMTLESVVQGTRVDTGRAKGNWQLSVDVPAEGDVAVPEGEGGAASTTAAQIALSTASNLVPGGALGHTIYIVNNVPYIMRLEQGHGSFSGDHMIQQAVNQFEEFVRVSEANAKAVYPD